MRISIVVPSYNQAKFLPYTLDSILCQDYDDLEVIVMDGGSTDCSVNILKSYHDPRLTWESKPDKGQSDAINQGLAKATGDILAYLCSDDTYLDDTLNYVHSYFQEHPDIDFIYGHCMATNAKGQSTGEIYARELSWKRIPMITFELPQPAAFWRKSVWDEIGGFDEEMRYRFDYDFWIRIFKHNYQMRLVNRVLATYRFHDTSKSVSERTNFVKDTVTIVHRIYSWEDLPDEVEEIKAMAYNNLNFELGRSYYYNKQFDKAIYHLSFHMRSPAPVRRRVISFVMLFESYTGLQITSIAMKIYLSIAKTLNHLRFRSN